MIVNEVTVMPNEFDFKSNNNSLCTDIIYHAKRKGIGDNYIITWNADNKRVYSEIMYYKKMYGKLKYGEFVITR